MATRENYPCLENLHLQSIVSILDEDERSLRFVLQAHILAADRAILGLIKLKKDMGALCRVKETRLLLS